MHIILGILYIPILQKYELIQIFGAHSSGLCTCLVAIWVPLLECANVCSCFLFHPFVLIFYVNHVLEYICNECNQFEGLK